MEKIIVFGATGMVGSRVVRKALEAGHEVTAYVRNSENYPLESPKLSFYIGNALDPVAMEKALPGHTIVISALGQKESDQPITLMSDAMGNLIDLMNKEGIKRVLAVGGAGILHESGGTLVRENERFPASLQNVSSDHLRVYELLQASELKWTMVCPPYIKEDKKDGKYVTKADYFPEHALNEVSADHVAEFLVKEATENKFIQRRVGIADQEG